MDTGIDILPEDTIVFNASGEIWAGVWLTGKNGPGGWNNVEYDLKFPFHGTPESHPYCLLARTRNSGWMFVGEQKRYTHLPPK